LAFDTVLSPAKSYDSAPLTLPLCDPTVIANLFDPMTPEDNLHVIEVSATHLELSVAECMIFAIELNEAELNPEPWIVTLADPELIAFLRVLANLGLVESIMGRWIEYTSLQLPSCTPAVIITVRDFAYPEVVAHRQAESDCHFETSAFVIPAIASAVLLASP
jgi:hypothetical protein